MAVAPEFGTAEYERERLVRTGLLVRLYRSLPEPWRRLYRTLLPRSARQFLGRILPHEQNLIEALHFWASPWQRRRMVDELQGSRTPDEVFNFAAKYLGHLQRHQEITSLLNFALTQRPVRICEVGMYLGGNNLMLTHALPSIQQVIGVDLYVRNRAKLRYFAKPSLKQVFIEGQSCDSTTLQKVACALGSEKLDLLFVDADHSYAGVKNDFMHYRSFVRDGGMIVFHDIVPDHLTRFGHDPATWAGANSGEVHVFWKRLKPYYETHEFVADYEQDGSGIGALIYSSKVPIPDDL